jgi:hypothetical protein
VSWSDIKREPHRTRRKAVSASKKRFYALDLPKLLAECELLTKSNKFGYCQIMQRYTNIEEVL